MTSLRGLVNAVRAEGRLASIVSAIVSSQLITGLLGFVFWGTAARLFPHAAVGAAGAASAAILLVATFSQLGQGSLLVSELPGATVPVRRVLLRSARTIAVLTGGAVGLGFFAVAGRHDAGSFHDFVLPSVAFVVAVVACAIVAEALVYDQSMLIVDRPRAQVVRNTIASGTRLGMLLVVFLLDWHPTGATASAVLLGAWAVGWLPSNAMARRAIVQRLPVAAQPRALLSELRLHTRAHASLALQHHATSMALASGFLLQPVVIGAFLSADENARFTAVRLASGLVLLIPYAIATALFTASGSDLSDLNARVRKTLKVSLAVSLGLYVLLFLTADPIVRVLGGDFAAPAADSLRLMAAAGPLLVFKDQYVAAARVRRRLAPALRLVAIGSALEVAAIVIGVHLGGLNGALIAWLLALAPQALLSGYRLRRAGRPAPRHEYRPQHQAARQPSA